MTIGSESLHSNVVLGLTLAPEELDLLGLTLAPEDLEGLCNVAGYGAIASSAAGTCTIAISAAGALDGIAREISDARCLDGLGHGASLRLGRTGCAHKPEAEPFRERESLEAARERGSERDSLEAARERGPAGELPPEAEGGGVSAPRTSLQVQALSVSIVSQLQPSTWNCVRVLHLRTWSNIVYTGSTRRVGEYPFNYFVFKLRLNNVFAQLKKIVLLTNIRCVRNYLN